MKFPETFRWHNAPAWYDSKNGDPFGIFIVPSHHANGRELKIVATDGTETGWEHVSVSLSNHPNKTPSWDEMCLVKSMFWEDEETIVQFHPPKSEHVNFHPGCLHLWKCVACPFPLPPSILVGPKTSS